MRLGDAIKRIHCGTFYVISKKAVVVKESLFQAEIASCFLFGSDLCKRIRMPKGCLLVQLIDNEY